LEHAHGIVRAQNDHSRAEVDATRTGGDGGESDVAGRHREVACVMLADTEEIDTDPVGEHALLDDASDRLSMRKRTSALVVDQIAKRVEAED